MTATQIYEWTLWAAVAISLAGAVYNSAWLVRHYLRQRKKRDHL